MWVKVVNDIKKFPKKIRQINCYKDGESLVHPRFIDMIRYLKDADVAERIWLKTNGSMLSPEYNERLVNCGLDMIGISVQHVHAQGFMDIAGVKIDYERFRSNVRDLYERRGGMGVSVKIADVGLSDNDKRKFFEDFSDRCDFITVEGLHGWSASEHKDWRLGTDKSFDGTPRTQKIACPLVLYMLTVNSNGKISICNDDWMQVHNIGDVNTESLIDIWNGVRLRDFRLMHLEGRKHENAACRNCDYMQALPDSIDEHRETFAERIRL